MGAGSYQVVLPTLRKPISTCFQHLL